MFRGISFSTFFKVEKKTRREEIAPTNNLVVFVHCNFFIITLIQRTSNNMPKEKKRGATTGSSSRHAPLGQVIADDTNRSKYASVRSRQREDSDKSSKYQEGDLLDEKSTKKIFELSKDQMLEIEEEEQKEMELKRRRGAGARGGADAEGDSSDEEEDNGSTMGDILNDEDEE